MYLKEFSMWLVLLTLSGGFLVVALCDMNAVWLVGFVVEVMGMREPGGIYCGSIRRKSREKFLNRGVG